MKEQIRVLFLAYYFPPDASSGSLRPLFLSNHLVELGIGVTILTSRVQDFLPSQPVDFSLLSRKHPAVNVVRTRVRRPREALLSIKYTKKRGKLPSNSGNPSPPSLERPISRFYQQLKDAVTDFLATPDPQMGWIPSAVAAGASLIREQSIHLICATGSPWSSMIAGSLLRRMTGRPLLLDFRDPWVTNPAAAKKSILGKKSDILLERMVLRHADVVANTEELRQDFLSRFSFLKREKVHVVFNGFESYLCDKPPRNKIFTTVHAGSLYHSRSPVPLLEALHQLIETREIPCEKIQLILVGECEIKDPKLYDILRKPSMQKVVKMLSRLPYETALMHQMQADLLLLIQPDFPLQIPRKLFEYMALRRPILAITEDRGATARMMKTFHLGNVVANEPLSIQKALLERFRTWETSGTSLLPESLTSGFHNSKQAERFATVLFDLVAKDERASFRLRTVSRKSCEIENP